MNMAKHRSGETERPSQTKVGDSSKVTRGGENGGAQNSRGGAGGLNTVIFKFLEKIGSPS